MLPNNSLLGVALRMVPLSICSPKRVCRSTTMSAPVEVADNSTQESQIASMAFAQTAASPVGVESPRDNPHLLFPAFSKARRSSG